MSTKMLLHFDDNLNDVMGNHSPSAIGSPSYVTGKSGFDKAISLSGSSQYVTVADSDDWNFGNGNFTIDFWVYIEDLDNARFFQQYEDSDNRAGADYNDSTGYLEYYVKSGGTGIIWPKCSWSPSINTWYHLALVRNGNDFKWYVDGVGQTMVDGTDSDSVPDLDGPFNIGYYNEAYLDGRIDEFRVNKGQALWASSFTPPSAPYQYVENPTTANLLMHFEDNVNDLTGGHSPNAVGSPSYATGQSGFGKAISLNGSTQYVNILDSDDWNFGSGDFTIEGLVNFNSTGTSHICSQWGDGGGSPDTNRAFTLNTRNGNLIEFTYTTDGVTESSIQSDTVTYSTGSWHHIATTRKGNVLRFFLDGIIRGSGDLGTDSIYNSTRNLNIGTYKDGQGEFINGLVDEIRILKGEAVWTDNFAPLNQPYSLAPTPASFGLYTYNSDFYFDTDLITGEEFEFNLTTPMSGDMSIFSKGGNVVGSNMPTYLYGEASESGFIHINQPSGVYTREAYMPLYIDNRVPDSGNISTYMRGVDASSGNIPIHEYGMIPVSGQNINMYSFGAYLESGIKLPMFVEGHIIFPIYTLGGQDNKPAGDGYAHMPLYIDNSQPSGGSTIITGETMPLYTRAIPSELNEVLPIYIMSDNGYSSGIFPIAINSIPKNPYVFSMPIYMPSTTTADVMGGEYQNMPVFSMGYYGTTTVVRETSWTKHSGVLPIYTEAPERAMLNMYTKCGPFPASGNISTYLISAYSGSGDIPLYITSDDFERSGDIPIFMDARQKALLSIYTLSKVEGSESINVYQDGILGNNNANMSTYLYGNQPISSDIWIYFHGF